ncbi:Cyclic nucleotide-gated channel 15 [Rhynchospora pubera]|uniref:Cyclic nucleotide-gated channel 15 n=1 Tax=Rhynchospora pubera TaxID=906938 RepID=A0AAV8BVM8_9POAL|nr:Cyclic nucleotide-gated channel 15 [Rhynchospora pubera]
MKHVIKSFNPIDRHKKVLPKFSISFLIFRFQEDLSAPKQKPYNSTPHNSPYSNKQTVRSWAYRTGTSKMSPHKPSKILQEGVLSRFFSEEYDSLLDVKKSLFDPHGTRIHRWNRIFLVACLVSLFIDPLFFYLPATSKTQCIQLTTSLEVALTVLRSLADLFYFAQIFVKFRTAFVAPSSRVFGRGELVIEPSEIAVRYLKSSFWLDLLSALPLPQFLIWVVVPNLKEATVTNVKNLIRFSIMVQYFPRLFLIFPLMRQIVTTTGVMTESAWAGAAYNLMLYMIASHVLGAMWYLLSVERQEACWKAACRVDGPPCQYSFFDCKESNTERNTWYQTSNLTNLCNPSSTFYQFGIYAEALDVNLTSSPFMQKYFYCFWWGLKNLSCLGQNLTTSTSVGEILFAIVIAVLGLVLFGLLIGNMQSYLQSTIVRLEEWRIRRRDMEQWMHHRKLPLELKQSVRRYHQYRWVATQGVTEESLLKDLPIDLRRDIKRHLCLDLVREVPLFDEMDDRMLEAICERLKPALFTKGTCIIRELDPVDSMLFIIRGYLDSCTTQGGRTGFFNSCRMGAGEFCGEELLTWALDPQPTAALPLSTRTVKALSDVEAFALVSSDLKFVSSQFRRLHSKQLRHKFRYYSNQWRTWAACFIQATWRQQKRRRASIELRLLEGYSGARQKPYNSNTKGETPVDVFSGKPVTNRRVRSRATAHLAKALKKPTEPDFTIEEQC